MEYEGINNNENIVHYLENRLIDRDNDFTPVYELFHMESEQFHISIG